MTIINNNNINNENDDNNKYIPLSPEVSQS